MSEQKTLGRPKLPDKQRRSSLIRVLVTRAECASWKAAAMARGLSLSEFVRDAAARLEVTYTLRPRQEDL